MKPSGNVARRGEYTVRPISLWAATSLVVAFHYARGAANTAVGIHGLFHDSRWLVGAALWMPPTRKAAVTVHEDWRNVLALSRFVCAPSEPTNAESLFLARSIRMLPERWHTLVTYADTREGHLGTIYRATNWRYVGEMRGAPKWIDPRTGQQVAARAKVTRTEDEMRALGYVRLPPSTKHKFTFHRSR